MKDFYLNIKPTSVKKRNHKLSATPILGGGKMGFPQASLIFLVVRP